MKIPHAIPADLGLLTESDFARIGEVVSESLKAAHERLAAARDARQRALLPAPANNMGGKSEDAPARLVLEDGQIVEVPARRGWGGDTAFVDWVNYTSHESAYYHRSPGMEFFNGSPVTDDEVIARVSVACLKIFGFGITAERPTGANFYKRSFVLGEGCGMVCYGGQRSTVLVMLSGAGCAAAAPGWEKRLYDWLVFHRHHAKITRIDLAHDDFTGERYSVDKADADFDAGLYCNGGRMPDCEKRGNWKRPNGKGRTFYVGHRSNGKFARIYEKGRELGDKSSEWNRVEAELKSIGRTIPFEALLEAGCYLAACYPAFAWISERQERIVTEQKKAEVTYESGCAWLKKQVGAWINALLQIEGSPEAVIAKIIRDEIPSRLKVPSYLFGGDWLHDRKREYPPLDTAIAAW
ncbi:MAG: replication initiation factor domain-containing protein [Rhodocyclaceae bacterium]|nr:replication initiation factor domain-containing protein [Rhodocyclaceae bacterium]